MAAGQLSWLEEIFTLNTVLLLDNMEPQLDFIIKPNSLMTVPLLIVESLGGVYFAGATVRGASFGGVCLGSIPRRINPRKSVPTMSIPQTSVSL